MKTLMAVSDITRMREPYICVAGITNNGETIRPLFRQDRIHQDWCFQNGTNIRQFTRITLNLLDHDPHPPHTEDWHADMDSLEIIGDVTEEKKLIILGKICDASLASIFGAEIRSDQGQQAVYIHTGEGDRSLGTVQPRRLFDFKYRCYERGWDYRVSFFDGNDEFYKLKIVDLTFQAFIDHQRICCQKSSEEIEEFVNQKIFSGRNIYIRIGLARGWADYPTRCYLQITGIHTFPDYLDHRCFHDLNNEIRAA